MVSLKEKNTWVQIPERRPQEDPVDGRSLPVQERVLGGTHPLGTWISDFQVHSCEDTDPGTRVTQSMIL